LRIDLVEDRVFKPFGGGGRFGGRHDWQTGAHNCSEGEEKDVMSRAHGIGPTGAGGIDD